MLLIGSLNSIPRIISTSTDIISEYSILIEFNSVCIFLFFLFVFFVVTLLTLPFVNASTDRRSWRSFMVGRHSQHGKGNGNIFILAVRVHHPHTRQTLLFDGQFNNHNIQKRNFNFPVVVLVDTARLLTIASLITENSIGISSEYCVLHYIASGSMYSQGELRRRRICGHRPCVPRPAVTRWTFIFFKFFLFSLVFISFPLIYLLFAFFYFFGCSCSSHFGTIDCRR